MTVRDPLSPTSRRSKRAHARTGTRALTRLGNLGQRVFKSEPKVAQTAPNATALGQPFITWLQSNFGWMFAQAQLDATLGQAYVYDDGQLGSTPTLLAEYGNGGSNAVGRIEYLWLPTESGQAIPIGQHRGSIISATHSDHLGTPRKITGTDNNTAWQWPYSAFGDNAPTGILTATSDPNLAFTRDAATNTKLAVSNPLLVYNLRFAGQYFDQESNLSYNYFRSYDARISGGYTQPDPIGLAGGLNRFGYVGGNPLSYSDPDGLQIRIPRPIPPGPGAGGGRYNPGADAYRPTQPNLWDRIKNACAPDDAAEECRKQCDAQLERDEAECLVARAGYGTRGQAICLAKAKEYYAHCLLTCRGK